MKRRVLLTPALFFLTLLFLPPALHAENETPLAVAVPTQGLAELSSRQGDGSLFELLKNSIVWKISGYEKSMFFITKTSGQTRDTLTGQSPKGEGNKVVELFTERLRVNLKADYSDYFSGYVSFDNQLRAGDFYGTGDSQILDKDYRDHQAVNTTWLLAHGRNVAYNQSLYRAYVDIKKSDLFKVRVGRQQIPWGVAHFFTPTDIFNPYRPTQIETDEREGVDGVWANTGVFKKVADIEFVFTPNHEDHPNRLAFKLKRNILGYDSSVLGGKRDRDVFIGFDFSGNLFNAVLRGEGIFVNASDGKNYSQITLNSDYNFSHNVYGLLEYHFNGQGYTRRSRYDWSEYLSGNITAMGRQYLAAILAKDITPLWRVELPVIWNLSDVSLVLMPEVNYLITDNWKWKCRASIFGGTQADEYGAPKNLYFSELQYFF